MKIRQPKPPKQPSILKLAFKVDPTRGFAASAVASIPVGYVFVSMDRKGTDAIVTYRLKEEDE